MKYDLGWFLVISDKETCIKMARLSLYLALATFLSLLSIGGFVLYSIIRHEPNFYKTALLVANDPNKGEKAKEFTS